MLIRKVSSRLSFASLRVRSVLLALVAVLPLSVFALVVCMRQAGESAGQQGGSMTPGLFWYMAFPAVLFLAVWLGSELLILRRIRLLLKSADRLSKGNAKAEDLSKLAEPFTQLGSTLEANIRHLRGAEERYRALVEHIPVVTYTYAASPNEVANTLYVSPQIEPLVGFTPQEWTSDPELWSKQLHPEDRDRVFLEYTRACTSSEPFYSEYRLYTRDGRIVWVRDNARVTPGPDGNAHLMQGVMLDITAQKRAEEMLRLSGGRLAGILDVAHDAIITVSKDQHVVLFNKGAERLFGYLAPEVLGKPVDLLLPPPSPEAYRQHISDLANSGDLARKAGAHREITGRRKDGSLFIAEAGISKLESKNDKVVTFVLRDITTRKHAEEALRDNELSYRLMFTDNPLPMWVYDQETLRFLEVNEAAVIRYGYSRDEFLQMHMTDIRAPEDVPRLVDNAANKRPEQQYSLQSRHKRKDGQIIDVQLVTHGFEFAGRKAALVVAEDITERNLAEEGLRESEKRFRAIFEGAAIGVALVDMEGRIVKSNPALQEMLGYSADELCSMVFREFTHPDDLTLNLSLREDGLESHKDYYQMEKRYYRKDGSVLWANLTVSLVRGHKRAPQFSIAMVEDITERKHAQEQVKRQLERQAALRNVDMTISASLDLRVTLNVILDQVTSQLRVDAADVLLLNPHTQMLEYSAGRGFRYDAISRSRLRLGEGYAGRAALERRTLSVPNLSDTGDLMRAQLLIGEEFVGYSAVPLLVKGQVKGVLEIFHRQTLDPQPEWLDFLEAMAAQAAIAIDNATLFNDQQRSNIELALAYDVTLEGWSRALDLRDKETEGHTQRVTEMTVRLARAMGVSEAELVQIQRGALLHDIGKMGIPDAILLKPGPLTDEEWEIMRRHPVYAYELLSPIAFLKGALDIPYCHHEKWDGTGYPRGLKGEQIPLPARIFAIVDVWDALRSDRPYRAAWGEERVREHIRSLSGTHFDPRVVKAFLELDLTVKQPMPVNSLLGYIDQKRASDAPPQVVPPVHRNGKGTGLLVSR